MPRFTIGIPTYNRAQFIKRPLASAVAQVGADVEVVVSDDGSKDDTEAVVRSFGDRVRYHRNETNLGMWPNFAHVATLARGEYFSWLQDDDAVHCDFARRATEALDRYPDAVMYTAYSADTYSHNTFVLPLLLGPPIALNWMSSEVRVVDGSMVLPISFFMTFSMPPITAYRTRFIVEASKNLDPKHVLYNERIVQSLAVAGRKIVVDPYLAGIFYKHDSQGSLLAGSCDIPERSRQWVAMANELSLLLEARPAGEWRPYLEEWIDNVPMRDLELIYLGHLPPPAYWTQLRPLASEICHYFLGRLPEPIREQHQGALANGDGVTRRAAIKIKGLGKQLTPPLVWDILRSIKQRSR